MGVAQPSVKPTTPNGPWVRLNVPVDPDCAKVLKAVAVNEAKAEEQTSEMPTLPATPITDFFTTF